jgi:hypothetical protein
VSGSPWENYHSIPLFAALDTLSAFGPTAPERVAKLEGTSESQPFELRPLGKHFLARRAGLIVDLPGTNSVAMAVRFLAAGYQPICTFDHWPHPLGLLKPEMIIGQLLRYASLVHDLSSQLPASAPPMWICDRDRLSQNPRPKVFDNRYYLDDSILPSPAILRREGIEHLVCVIPDRGSAPSRDLAAWFGDLMKAGFQSIWGAAADDPDLNAFQFHPNVLSVKFYGADFSRSNAGGFGSLVPEPGSSGG